MTTSEIAYADILRDTWRGEVEALGKKIAAGFDVRKLLTKSPAEFRPYNGARFKLVELLRQVAEAGGQMVQEEIGRQEGKR